MKIFGASASAGYRPWCLGALAMLAAATSSRWAGAWEALECSGQVYAGIHSAVTFAIDRCDTPDGSSEDAVIDYAVAAWNNIFGMWDRFNAPVNGDNNCDVPAATSGSWQLALVPANDALLDGNAGMTSSLSPSDCTNNGAMLGASVVVDQTLSLTALSELSQSLGARETLIHELGHVLGANHEDGNMSVMCTSTAGSCGKVGRFSAAGGVGTPDIRSETLLPDDADFAFQYHSSTSTGNVDAIVSPWRYSSGPVRNYGPTTRTLCPGQSTTVQFSYGNKGKVNIAQASPVGLRVVVSNNTTISTGDVTATSGTFWADSGGFGTTTWSFTVPALASGTYHVGIIADPTSAFTEDDEWNNAAETGLRIFVPTGC